MAVAGAVEAHAAELVAGLLGGDKAMQVDGAAGAAEEREGAGAVPRRLELHLSLCASSQLQPERRRRLLERLLVLFETKPDGGVLPVAAGRAALACCVQQLVGSPEQDEGGDEPQGGGGLHAVLVELCGLLAAAGPAAETGGQAALVLALLEAASRRSAQHGRTGALPRAVVAAAAGLYRARADVRLLLPVMSEHLRAAAAKGAAEAEALRLLPELLALLPPPAAGGKCVSRASS